MSAEKKTIKQLLSYSGKEDVRNKDPEIRINQAKPAIEKVRKPRQVQYIIKDLPIY